MSTARDFPALGLLLQGYLGLDWPEEYGDPWAAVDDFAISEPEQAARVTHEVTIALDGTTEDALERLVVNELGSGYLPTADGWSFRCWLQEVARRIGDR